MLYGVTCSKFKSVNGSTVCKIATQHFPHNPTQIYSSIPRTIKKQHMFIDGDNSYILPWHNLKSALVSASASRWSERFAVSMYRLRVARAGRQHGAPASCRQSSRHTCSSYAYMCRDDGGGFDVFIRNAPCALKLHHLSDICTMLRCNILDMRMGRFGC